MTVSDWDAATAELQASTLSDLRLSWADGSLFMEFMVGSGERRYTVAMRGVVFFKSSLMEWSDIGYTVYGVAVQKVEGDVATLLSRSGFGFIKFDVAEIERLYPLYHVQVDGETCIQALARHIEGQTGHPRE
jgi:hypothetical protein